MPGGRASFLNCLKINSVELMVEQIQGLLFSNETGTKMRKKHFILINQIT